MTDSFDFEELEFSVGDHCLCGRLYGRREDKPILALHGWLDNCASFEFIAPIIAQAGYCFLALDLSGHGQSDHRKHLGAYNIWQDIPELLQVTNQLKWQSFALVGHSRGAMIAMIFAAVCPDRVNFLGLIDGIAPLPIDEMDTLEQLQRAVLGTMEFSAKSRTVYHSFDAAVKAREEGFIALRHDDALVLAKRGVKEKDGKFYWNNDMKLMIPSELKYTEAQVHQFMLNITLQITLIIGNQGLINDFAHMQDWLKQYSRVYPHYIEGYHHLHMSTQASKVAEILLNSLAHI